MKPLKKFVQDHLNTINESGKDPGLTNWNKTLESGGYHQVQCPDRTAVAQEASRWCRENFGGDHYVWTGSNFWFDREEDAVLFALKWL